MKKLFDEIPRLQNQRVVLKQITHEDADALREMTQSAAVYRFLPTFCSRSSLTIWQPFPVTATG